MLNAAALSKNTSESIVTASRTSNTVEVFIVSFSRMMYSISNGGAVTTPARLTAYQFYEFDHRIDDCS